MKALIATMTLIAVANGRWIEHDAAVKAWRRGVPMVVVIGSEWCQPCKVLRGEAGKIDGVSLVYIDGEKDQIAGTYPKVMTFPTTYVFRVGKPTAVITGNEPAKLREAVRRALE